MSENLCGIQSKMGTYFTLKYIYQKACNFYKTFLIFACIIFLQKYIEILKSSRFFLKVCGKAIIITLEDSYCLLIILTWEVIMLYGT